MIITLFAAYVLIAQEQTAQLSNQQTFSQEIQNHASHLVYLSNDYFLYHDSNSLTQWQTEFSSLSDSLSKVSVSSPEQQTLLNKITEDAQQLNESWAITALYLETTPLDVTVRNIPEFQADWSIMSAQNQALIFDAQQQAQGFRTQIDQLNLTTIILIFTLLGIFGAYFIINYLITYRNTLKSISKLQAGIGIIGSGNLDHTIEVGNKDEIADISASINLMATDLKRTTASKNDLEKEVAERKKAELNLKQRTEQLENTQVKLEENAVQLEEYASQMEELAEQRANKLKDSERLAAIGATAGMVGHDIRNPLQAITGDLYLVKTELAELSDTDQKKNALESLDEIQKNVDYINKIVADLQDFARPLNPRAQETNIKSVLNEIVIKNGIPKNIILTVDVEDNAEKVMADPDYLKRIFSNLTLNAVQAMPNGGKLTIHAFTDKQTNDILITVKDTGVGIPEAVKSKLFTPMMTTKSKGQGFGLAVVKRMTEGVGGTVTFESQEGKGTTFTVRLPPKS